MKKTVIYLIITASAVLTSCAGGYNSLATTNRAGTKVGIVKDVIWFGIGSIDVGVATAAKQGGITKISTYESYMRAGLFHRTYYTKVTGE